MNIHQNARLTRHGRERIVRLAASGQTPTAIANTVGVCPRTVRKWLQRYREEGPAGLLDRSSRPHRLYRPLPDATLEGIAELRRQRWTGKQIAAEFGISPASVSRVLKRFGLNKLRALEPAEPIRRYQRDKPGELIHIDIKKLGRFERIGHRITGDRTRQSSARGRRNGQNWGAGWEYVHVCIKPAPAQAGDASRIAFGRIFPNEKADSAVAFPKAAITYFAKLGIAVSRVMTDNGACYKACAFRNACRDLGIKHIRTRPYTPRTNGKAERFIQTALREWAYAQAYPTSNHRAAELPYWLHRYNWHRPHGSLDAKPPISRLGLSEDNLLRLHS
ncbi:MAG: IS481 family transposase [Alphaproteobacteria bacterium]